MTNITTLAPKSQMSRSVLPLSGSTNNVDAHVPFRIYSDSDSSLYSKDFLKGAAKQVNYVYKKLGGDVLDLEITEGNVYAAYEEAVLEYSYILNIHQANNSLHSSLGHTTGTFDHLGEIKPGTLSSSLDGDKVGLKFPKFDFGYARKVSEGVAAEIGMGRGGEIYSASFAVTEDKQDYDLQEIVQLSSSYADYARGQGFHNKVGNKKIIIKKVYYKTPHAAWRFYGYYGGLNVVGNFHNYGQYSDDSTFELIPAWQNKSQALAYEDAIYTRMSHWSYELKDNKIRLFPIPKHLGLNHEMWIHFSLQSDPWEEDNADTGISGVNNMNTLPFSNLPYENINGIGKQWIRRFALALCKEVLGQVRSKFGSVPIPGESVTLNGGELVSQAKEEQDMLRTELKETLAELTYSKLAAQTAETIDSVNKVQERIPLTVYVG